MANVVTGWRLRRPRGLLACLGIAASASAQMADPIHPDRTMQLNMTSGSRYSLVSRTDAYGNARALYQPIRTTSQFLDAGLTAASGATQPFGLSRLPTTAASASQGRPLDPVGGLASSARGGSAWQRRAFAAYGGFERRDPRRRSGDLSMAFERRYALVAATGMNAPVHRASLRSGLPSFASSSIDRQPFVPRAEGQDEAWGVPLDEWLRDSGRQGHARAHAQAAAAFRAGEYRRAAASYETVVMLEPGDVRGRVGELFCYLALGANATAAFTSGELARRPENPFLADLDMTAAFGDSADAMRIRADAMVDGATDPRTLALRTLALWYVGERDEAARVARAMPRHRAAGRFTGWAKRLEAARSANRKSAD